MKPALLLPLFCTLGCASAETADRDRDRDRNDGAVAARPADFAAQLFDLSISPTDGGPADLASAGDGGPTACGTGCLLTVTTGMLGSLTAAGDSWDNGGGLPDAYVKVSLLGMDRSTIKRDETLTPTWNQSLYSGLSEATLVGGFRVEVLDEDPLNSDDTMALWGSVVPTHAQLVDKKLTLTQGTGSKMMTILLTF